MTPDIMKIVLMDGWGVGTVMGFLVGNGCQCFW